MHNIGRTKNTSWQKRKRDKSVSGESAKMDLWMVSSVCLLNTLAILYEVVIRSEIYHKTFESKFTKLLRRIRKIFRTFGDYNDLSSFGSRYQ